MAHSVSITRASSILEHRQTQGARQLALENQKNGQSGGRRAGETGASEQPT